LPLYHDMGLIGAFLGSAVAQVDLWLMRPIDFIRSPATWLNCHGQHGVSITTAPNFGYAYAAARVRDEELAGADFSGWRAAMSGAERVDVRVAADFAVRLAPHGFRPAAFAPCYGMAETTLATSGVTPGTGARIVRVGEPLRTGESVAITGEAVLGVDRPDDAERWLSSCGGAIAQTAIEIVDEDGKALEEGVFGEVRVSGASVAHGYQSAADSAAFTAAGLRTGDAGFLLAGELFVVGRIGDSLKVRGRNVHAEDVEASLTSVPGVRPGRCAVALGTWRGRGRAVVVIEANAADWLDDVTALLRAAFDGSVATTIVRGHRGVIPRTSSGKPRRRTIWQLACDGALAGDVVRDTFAHASTDTSGGH
jgi:acyl-CoA synthetase (AMP-forming)/AMP-acid ligase II